MAVPDCSAGKTARVRKQQDRSIHTRQRILAAATTEFVTLGFLGVTTRSIAAMADVPHGLVVYHFGTKLEVWRAVMERAITDFHNALETVVKESAGDDPVAALHASQRVFIEMSASRPVLNWLISHEMGCETERLSWLLERIAGRDIATTIDLISQAQRLGRYAAGDPAHLHLLFVGAASRIFLMPAEVKRLVGSSTLDNTFLEQHISLCQSLFFRDPPAESAN